MDIKVELLKGYVSDFINGHINDFGIDADYIANTTAISLLSEIRDAIVDEGNTDFEVVEKIVCAFEKCGIDCGGRHDF